MYSTIFRNEIINHVKHNNRCHIITTVGPCSIDYRAMCELNSNLYRNIKVHFAIELPYMNLHYKIFFKHIVVPEGG